MKTSIPLSNLPFRRKQDGRWRFPTVISNHAATVGQACDDRGGVRVCRWTGVRGIPGNPARAQEYPAVAARKNRRVPGVAGSEDG